MIKKTDTVTKIKLETNEPAEHTEARKDNEKLFEEIKELMGCDFTDRKRWQTYLIS